MISEAAEAKNLPFSSISVWCEIESCGAHERETERCGSAVQSLTFTERAAHASLHLSTRCVETDDLDSLAVAFVLLSDGVEYRDG